MHIFFLSLLLSFSVTCRAAISGPFLFWGHEKVLNLQPKALIEATEEDFVSLFRESKSVVVFVRNSTGNRLDSFKYPKFQSVIQHSAWSYLPQKTLAAEPFDYNDNIEIINLSGVAEEEDIQIVSAYNEALAIYGDGEVLAILANREDDIKRHFINKRDAKDTEETRSTIQPPVSEENQEDFIYIADGKAILYVNTAPKLQLSYAKEPFNLTKHLKSTTFDDQSKTKNYGRLIIIFSVDKDKEKLFLRFNFTVNRGTWAMKSVDVDYKGTKTVLNIEGGMYNVPSAPIGFSYRCSTRKMIFTNGNDTLELDDYQVQPWLDGAKKFGSVIDCVGFTTAPIWTGVIVSLFLCGILSIGLLAILDIKTPNRFESSRSKQLTFTVQE